MKSHNYPEGLVIDGDMVLACPVELMPVELPRTPQSEKMPLDDKFEREFHLQQEVDHIDPQSRRMVWARNSLTIYDVMHRGEYAGGLLLSLIKPEFARQAIIGHVELLKQTQGKRLGVAAIVAAQLELPDDYQLVPSVPMSPSGEGLMKVMEELGLAYKERGKIRDGGQEWPSYRFLQLQRSNDLRT